MEGFTGGATRSPVAETKGKGIGRRELWLDDADDDEGASGVPIMIESSASSIVMFGDSERQN